MSKGKLISVWNPISNKMGSTTTAIGISTLLSWFGHKKVLLTSFSQDNSLSLYIKNDINVEYSLDNLKILQDTITERDIKMYSTAVNDNLDVVGGYKLEEWTIKGSKEFSKKFIEKALGIYDFVVLDMSNNIDQVILDQSDVLLSMLPFEPLKLQEFSNNSLFSYILDEKNISLFNNIPLGLEKELKSIIPEYKIFEYNYLPTNKYAYYSTVISYNFYSFVVENSHKTNQVYMKKMLETYDFIVDKTGTYKEHGEPGMFEKIFKRISLF